MSMAKPHDFLCSTLQGLRAPALTVSPCMGLYINRMSMPMSESQHAGLALKTSSQVLK